MTPELRAAVFALPPDQKHDLIGELWNDLCDRSENSPVPNWQMEEVLRRKAEFEANPESGMTWDEVVASARAKYGR